MRIRDVIVLVVVFGSNWVAPSFAGIDRDVGVRVGLSGPDKGERFLEVDVYLVQSLPWLWNLPFDCQLLPLLDLALGTLKTTDKTAIMGSFSPGIKLRRRGSRLSILANTGIALVSEHDFGSQAIGGSFQFGLYAGALYRVGTSVYLSYRYRHLSNAGFFQPNPGMEMHFIGLSYGF